MRIKNDRIRPLEIWDALTPAGTLWESMNHPEFANHLEGVLDQLLKGTAYSRADGPITAVDYDRIWLSGGRLLCTETINKLNALPYETIMAVDVRFPGVAAVSKILPDCDNAVLCVDVGQTSIKMTLAEHRVVTARDYDNFPIRNHGNDTPSKRNQHRFLQWLISSIQTLPTFVDRPLDIILSLPCEIADDGTLGGSSYIGVIGCTETVSILKQNLSVNSVHLLNDAELAAWSALADTRLPDTGKTLVLTLGFGVGAALIEEQGA